MLTTGARIVLRALDHRVRLAALELGEARSHVLLFVGLALAAVALGQMAFFAGLAALMAQTWDTSWRVLAPLLAAGVCLALALVAGGWAWWRIRHWTPFEETSEQVNRDANCLNGLFGSSPEREDDDA
jgi:uncharacterized membrane protein YqjE